MRRYGRLGDSRKGGQGSSQQQQLLAATSAYKHQDTTAGLLAVLYQSTYLGLVYAPPHPNSSSVSIMHQLAAHEKLHSPLCSDCSDPIYITTSHTGLVLLLVLLLLPTAPHPTTPFCLANPQLYELAASGVRERAKLRQEVNEVQHELQGTRRQLHAFMASLMQLKNSMASAGDGDLEHALELLQNSSYSASLNSKWLCLGRVYVALAVSLFERAS